MIHFLYTVQLSQFLITYTHPVHLNPYDDYGEHKHLKKIDTHSPLNVQQHEFFRFPTQTLPLQTDSQFLIRNFSNWS